MLLFDCFSPISLLWNQPPRDNTVSQRQSEPSGWWQEVRWMRYHCCGGPRQELRPPCRPSLSREEQERERKAWLPGEGRLVQVSSKPAYVMGGGPGREAIVTVWWLSQGIGLGERWTSQWAELSTGPLVGSEVSSPRDEMENSQDNAESPDQEPCVLSVSLTYKW